jgi:hypothetical protein
VSIFLVFIVFRFNFTYAFNVDDVDNQPTGIYGTNNRIYYVISRMRTVASSLVHYDVDEYICRMESTTCGVISR